MRKPIRYTLLLIVMITLAGGAVLVGYRFNDSERISRWAQIWVTDTFSLNPDYALVSVDSTSLRMNWSNRTAILIVDNFVLLNGDQIVLELPQIEMELPWSRAIQGQIEFLSGYPRAPAR